jgi:hypothetical protein
METVLAMVPRDANIAVYKMSNRRSHDSERFALLLTLGSWMAGTTAQP